MKATLKKTQWFTVITTQCLVAVTLFAAVSCDKSDILPKTDNDVSFTSCRPSKLKSSEFSDKVEVEFSDKGVQITYYGFEVTCDFTTVNVNHTLVNGVLDISQQGTPNQADCICYTDVSYTIDGILQDEVNVISINGVQVYCYNDNSESEEISGTWEVKSISVFGKLTDIGLAPDDALYSNILIEIPDEEQGYIEGNTFYNKIEFEFEKNEYQQIYIHNGSQYVENELLIWLEQGVDATQFAANSNEGITPKRLLSKRLNVWLFETDGTIPLRLIISNLSQHPDVTTVSYNHAGITLRDSDREIEVNHFIENIRNIVKFEISNNELKFMDSRNNIVIVFIKPLK